MLSVFSITFPIFFIVLIGYLATWRGITSKADIRGLGVFVIRFGLPALIFRSLSQRAFAEIVNPRFLLVYGLASLAMFLLAFLTARLAGRPVTESAIQGLGAAVPNSGFIGYPVTALVIGPPAVIALALAMMIENLMTIPLGLVLAEGGRSGGGGRSQVIGAVVSRLVRNPLIIAIAAGMIFSIAGLSLPQPLFRAVDMLAMASGAAALFSVGGTLVGLSVRGMLPDVGRMVAAKLIGHPLAVWLALSLAPPLEPDLKKAVLIMAAVPTMTVLPMIGQPFGLEKTAAAALMAATTLSFFTISALLYVL